MDVRNILLTGDDGYNSIGTRLLIHYLKDRYDLSIAGTKDQQSGVGGMINVTKAIHWREIKVDGVNGICVDGTPVDAIEVAQAYFNKSFDLVISGINLGANVGGSFFSSGTIAAILRAIILNLTKKGITISYHILDPRHWFHNHHADDSILPYIDYPGKTVHKIVEQAIAENFWGASFVNINLPQTETKIVKFTKPEHDLGKFYIYPGHLNRKDKTYNYPMTLRKTKRNTEYDSGALQNGYISITPCKADLLDQAAYRQQMPKTFTLD